MSFKLPDGLVDYFWELVYMNRWTEVKVGRNCQIFFKLAPKVLAVFRLSDR